MRFSSSQRAFLPAISILSLVAACDTSHTPASAGVGSGGSAGGAGGAGGGTTSILSPGGLAVLSSDQGQLTTLSLYDPATEQLLRDDCVRSGTHGGALVQELSGDVTLPTQADPVGHEIALIDRMNVTLTFVDPATCAVRTQIAVGGVGADGHGIAGFKSNPRDLIRLDAHKAYVTRYETNATATPAAADLDDGNDVLVLDPTSGLIQKRIDLTAEATAGAGVLARPDRGVYAEGRVYVTLGNYDLRFAVAGVGRVVVIDPASDTVAGHIDLPDQKGCSGLEYLPATHKLYVACRTFTDDAAAQLATSALVEIDLSGAGLGTVARAIPAMALGAQPLTFSHAAVLDGIAYVTQSGSFPDPAQGTPASSDVLQAVWLDTLAAQKLFDGGAYNLGRVAAIAESHRVYLPDGDAIKPRVHVFSVSSGTPVAAGEFVANPAGQLPPREIARY